MSIANLVRRIKQIPPVRLLRRLRHANRFWSSKTVMHLGVFQSFKEALAAIPNGKNVGWDNPASAAMFMASEDRINPRDYPVLFWMQSIWRGQITVFDYGGHIGVKRYAFERYLNFDADKHWIVCDVPEVIAEGLRFVKQRNLLNVSFTTDFGRAGDCALLLCLGVLQFIEKPLALQLQSLNRLPPHLIVNGLPLHPRLSYVTLVNNQGTGFCPYRVFQRDEFIDAIVALGYRLVDDWTNVEKSCWIPVNESHNVGNYTGLYFRRV